MYARLSRYAGLPPERLFDVARQYEQERVPELEQSHGFRGTFFAVDHRAGKATAVSFWETRHDLEASDEAAKHARERRTNPLDPSREPIVDRYEVVLLRMPEGAAQG